jgi:hypothetical protein
VELDLLRGAKPMAVLGVRSLSPYRILISRSQQRPNLIFTVLRFSKPYQAFPFRSNLMSQNRLSHCKKFLPMCTNEHGMAAELIIANPFHHPNYRKRISSGSINYSLL